MFLDSNNYAVNITGKHLAENYQQNNIEAIYHDIKNSIVSN